MKKFIIFAIVVGVIAANLGNAVESKIQERAAIVNSI